MLPDDSPLEDTATHGPCKWIASTQTAAALTGRDGQLITISNRLKQLFPELAFYKTDQPTAQQTEHNQNICFVNFLAGLTDAKSEAVTGELWEVVKICRTDQLSQTIPLNCSRNSHLLLTVSCQIDHSGEPNLLVWVFQESSVQRRLQQRDLHSSKMEAISRLAGGMAHEFNNLLTAILGNLELVRSQPAVQVASVSGRLESAEVAALRASQLIRELRRFASREAPRREVALITKSLRKVHRILPGMVSRNIEVSHSFEDEEILFAEINSGQLAACPDTRFPLDIIDEMVYQVFC